MTERNGKSIKIMIWKICEEMGCKDQDELMKILDVAVQQKNRLMNVGGYSPMQRVLGYQPKVPGGLLSGGHNNFAHISKVEIAVNQAGLFFLHTRHTTSMSVR